MVRSYYKRGVACALAFIALLSAAKAQDVWGGGFPDDNIDSPTNWVGDAVPPGYMAGTDTLVFNSSSNSGMNLDVAGISFAGIELNDDGDGVNMNIYGSNSISIGGAGIALSPIDFDSLNVTISAPVVLTANQTWFTGPEGSIRITGPVSGAGVNLVLSGGSGEYFEFDSGSSSFSGSLQVTGNGTVLVAGNTGTPFGTGPLFLGDNVQLQPQYSGTVVLPNDVTFGDSTLYESDVKVGNDPTFGPAPGSVTFNGNATFNFNGPESNYSEVDLQPNTTLTLNGALNGANPGLNVIFGTTTYNANFNSLVYLGGDVGPNVSQLSLEGEISVVLNGNPVTQLTNLANINTGSSTYLGLGENYIGNVTTFLGSSQINQGTFSGTLGFDNTTGGTSTFGEDINLANFNPGQGFVGLGSATSAILTGTITPPGGLALMNGTTYLFGGGGGQLRVTSSLGDSSYFDGETFQPEPNGVQVSPGNGPLTLVLSGPLSYTGTSSVDGAVLIFDSPVPSGGIEIGEIDSPGYVGVTANTQYIADGSGGAGTHFQDFINLIDTESQGVVGFEGGVNVSDAIDMHLLPEVYLGTASTVTYSGAITPANGTFQFAGVKGGQVTVTSPSLAGGASLNVGLPTPMESFGSVSEVILPGDNSYTGGTFLNSGYLYVGQQNSLGYGNLFVEGPSTGSSDIVGLVPFNADVTLDNDIILQTNTTHLGRKGVGNTLTLFGSIGSESEGETNLMIDSPVNLAAANSFSGGITVNGTTLTVSNDDAISNTDFIQATTGSTLNFTTGGEDLVIDNLDLQGSTATFSFAGGLPRIYQLSMGMGSLISFADGSSPYIGGMQSDEANSGNVIMLGSATSLTFNLEADPDYHGTIVGPSDSSIYLESGQLNLSGASTLFSGSVTIGDNATIIAGNDAAMGSGPVTVNQYGTLIANTGVTISNPLTNLDGSTLAGFGTFSPGTPVVIQNASVLVPGSTTLTGTGAPNSIPVTGTLTFGATTPLTFGTDGELYFGITDASGAAGSGYSTVNAAGGLTINATSGNPFRISLFTFAPGTNQPYSTDAANFDSSLGYSWTLVSSSTAISGFDPTVFTIDTSGFHNSMGTGGFYITDTGNDLVLNFSPVPEPSTWAMLATGMCAICLFGMRQARRRRAA